MHIGLLLDWVRVALKQSQKLFVVFERVNDAFNASQVKPEVFKDDFVELKKYLGVFEVALAHPDDQHMDDLGDLGVDLYLLQDIVPFNELLGLFGLCSDLHLCSQILIFTNRNHEHLIDQRTYIPLFEENMALGCAYFHVLQLEELRNY